MKVTDQIDFAAQIGDIKLIEYKNTLVITSILELLLEKNIISKEDIVKKAKELDSLAVNESKKSRKNLASI